MCICAGGGREQDGGQAVIAAGEGVPPCRSHSEHWAAPPDSTTSTAPSRRQLCTVQ